MPTITVSAVLITDRDGRFLSVRKRGTAAFMLPGGKPERDEAPEATAAREIREELGLRIPLGELAPLGRYETAAANEAGHRLIGEVFAWTESTRHVGQLARLKPHAEIEELLWLSPQEAMTRPDVAPLTRDCVLPGLPGTRV